MQTNARASPRVWRSFPEDDSRDPLAVRPQDYDLTHFWRVGACRIDRFAGLRSCYEVG